MGEPIPDKKQRTAQVRPLKARVCRVRLLDDTEFGTDVDKRAVGQILFDKVCQHLDLLEVDYYGLSYINPSTGLKNWLNNEKKISKQLKGIQWSFDFEVKFYPPDPQQLHEDLTRYQLCLQIRKDIITGKLPCSVVTYSLLGSYTVQSELGDFDVEEFGPGVEYIRKMQFAPKQDRDLLKKIAELHKTHKGQSPEEAELNFLEHAKKLAMYGVEMFDAKDGEHVDIQLGVCSSGILVFREKLQINKFVWPKILKMSYRRTKFYIKLRTAEFDDFQTLVGFKFLSSKHAKRMWKVCVEHHAFFRNREPDSPGTRRGVLRFGSRFRYSGRTQFQSKQAMQMVDRPSPYFDRVHSQHGKRATYHGKTKHKRLEDEMFKPRPPPAHRAPPQYDGEDYDRKPIPQPEIPDYDRKPFPEPEIRDHEDVFEHEEEPENRKSRMEKIHGIPTPLAAVIQKSNHSENNNLDHTPPLAHDEDEDSIHKPPREEYLERSNESPSNHMPPQDMPLPEMPAPPPDSPKLLSKEERKRAEKMEKERKKREKEEEKRRKKEQEKERKRVEKEKKKKGKEEIKKEWKEAVAVAETGPAVVMETEEPARTVKRMSSFEERKSEDKVHEKQDDEESDKGDVNSTKAEEGETISDLDDADKGETTPQKEKEDPDPLMEQLKARIGEEVTL